MSYIYRTLKLLAGELLVLLVLIVITAQTARADTCLTKAQFIYQALQPYILSFDIDLRSIGQNTPENPPEGNDNLIAKINGIVEQGKPLHLFCLAFPFKSGNRTDLVIGHLPDMAEYKSLGYLQKMVDQIKNIYPDTHLTIMTDGLLFNDLFQIEDRVVLSYEEALQVLCEHFPDIGIKTLSNALDENNLTLAEFRDQANHYNSKTQIPEDRLELLKQRIKVEINHQDHIFSKLQNYQKDQELKRLALLLIKRDQCLKNFVKRYITPNTLRLSIHYQSNISNKIGIKLTPSSNIFPWNGVTVETAPGKAILLPKNLVDKKIYSYTLQSIQGHDLPLYRWR